jgi:hypothetical protein
VTDPVGTDPAVMDPAGAAPLGGILTAGSPGSWWAWAGARLAPAHPPEPAAALNSAQPGAALNPAPREPGAPLSSAPLGPGAALNSAPPEPAAALNSAPPEPAAALNSAPPEPAAALNSAPPGPVSAIPGQLFAGTATNVVQSRDIHGNVVFNIGQHQAAPPDLLPWLGTIWQSCVDIGAAVELRLLNQPDHTLAAYLLCRTTAPDQYTAATSAAWLRELLPSGIPHVVAAPVETQPRLSAVLEPFVPHHQGILEIRKRVTVAHSIRTDARPPWLAAVTPLAGGSTSWQSVWANLAAFPGPAVLSVRLAPIRIGPGLRSHLAERAREFARLAVPGPPPNPTWPVPRPADPFAAAAQDLFTSALGRYTELAFGIRVSLAASGPLLDDIAQLLVNTISPPHPGIGFTADTPVIVRPRTMQHATTAWRNITALNADPIGPVAPEGVPEECVGDVARALATTADIHEAASVFRPPYPIEGSPRVFSDDAALNR